MYYFCLQYNIFVDIQNVLLDLLQQARVVKLQFGTTAWAIYIVLASSYQKITVYHNLVVRLDGDKSRYSKWL